MLHSALRQPGFWAGTGTLQRSHIQHCLALPLYHAAGKARCQRNGSASSSGSQGSHDTARVLQVCCMDAHQRRSRLNSSCIQLHIQCSYLRPAVLVHACPVVLAVNLHIETICMVPEIDRPAPVWWHHLMAVVRIQPKGPQQLHEPALTAPHCAVCRYSKHSAWAQWAEGAAQVLC